MIEPNPVIRLPLSTREKRGYFIILHLELEIRVRSKLSPFHEFFFSELYKGQFENANICIFPTFEETVESHLKPRRLVVVMATLNQFY